MKRNLLLVLLSSMHLQALAYDFKDIKLGGEVSSLQSNNLYRCTSTKSALGDLVCMFGISKRQTIAGIPITFLSVHSNNGIIGSINIRFSENGFSDVKSAFIEKYSPPITTETQVLKNRMGTEFESSHLKWEDELSYMTLTQRVSKIDESAASFTLKSYIDDFAKRKADITKEKSSDL
jgi:hypothetical protein